MIRSIQIRSLCIAAKLTGNEALDSSSDGSIDGTLLCGERGSTEEGDDGVNSFQLATSLNGIVTLECLLQRLGVSGVSFHELGIAESGEGRLELVGISRDQGKVKPGSSKLLDDRSSNCA